MIKQIKNIMVDEIGLETPKVYFIQTLSQTDINGKTVVKQLFMAMMFEHFKQQVFVAWQ